MKRILCLVLVFLFCTGFVIDKDNPDFLVRIKTEKIKLVDGEEEKGLFLCTGFFVAEGVVVTASHCIEDAFKTSVVFYDDKRELKEYPAFVLGDDPLNDIAVLRIDGYGGESLSFCSAISSTTTILGYSQRHMDYYERTVGRTLMFEPDGSLDTTLLITFGFSGGPALDAELVCVQGVIITLSIDRKGRTTSHIIHPIFSTIVLEALLIWAPDSIKEVL